MPEAKRLGFCAEVESVEEERYGGLDYENESHYYQYYDTEYVLVGC